MILPRRLFAAVGLFSIMAFAIVSVSNRPIPKLPPLPAGKVKPYLWDDLLLAPDGTLWSLSHIGSGGRTSLVLKPLAPGNDWKQVSGVAGRGVGIKQDGTLWLWQTAGAPFLSTPAAPVQIGLERDWAQASHSWNYAPLLKTDGTLWYLGEEEIDSTTPPSQLTPAMRPLPLGTDRDWATITNCNGAYYALKKDGALWQWGNSNPGGPFDPTPQPVSPERKWSAITRCAFALAALERDGSLWICGANAHVVASDTIAGPAATPVRVGSESHWVEIIGGENSVVARHTDGSWWALGENRYAHLGLPHWFGHSKHLGKPTRIPLDLQLWAWSAGVDTTLLLTRDGNLSYMGRTPRSSRAGATGLAGLKRTINRGFSQIPGMPQPFARPGESWSKSPVKIGELPPSVVTALEKER